VRDYKALANVERAFRSLKTIDLKVRPIHHRLADRVRADIFLSLLADYVEWHLREAWRVYECSGAPCCAMRNTLCFFGDPVFPAQRASEVLRLRESSWHKAPACQSSSDAVGGARVSSDYRGHGYPGLPASSIEGTGPRPMVDLGNRKLAPHIRVP
jgi:hypothetical protein